MSNNKLPQIIFKAELVERDGKKQVVCYLNSKHIPTLDYIANELVYEITELRAAERTEAELKKSAKIIPPTSKLMNFIRRGQR